jgi:hypothetical protein
LKPVSALVACPEYPEVTAMSRQTQPPEYKSGKTRESDCEVKQRMTPHWDLDYLSREELEAEMARGFGHDGSESETRKEPPATADDETAGNENPFRIGLTLLLVSVAMMVGAVLLLQSGGN